MNKHAPENGSGGKESQASNTGSEDRLLSVAPVVAAGALLVLGALSLLGLADHHDVGVLVGGSLMVVGAFVALASSVSQRQARAEDRTALPASESPLCSRCARELLEDKPGAA